MSGRPVQRTSRGPTERAGPRRAAGAAAFNTLISCIVIALLISTGMTYGLRFVRLAREEALRYELANIRTAVLLFAALNRRFPTSLRELVESDYLLPNQEFSITAPPLALEKRTGFSRSYLEPLSTDTNGQVLDPFGKPYRYNPRRGQVTASGERYGQW